MSYKKKIDLTFKICCFILIHTTFALSADYRIVWPENGKMAKDKDRVANDRPYEKRHGSISVASAFVKPDSPVARGDSLTVSFFSDLTYVVIADSVKSLPDGTTIISGRPMDSSLSTFVLTVDKKNYIITLQDVEKNTTYRATGSMENGTGYVKQIDMEKLPPVIHKPSIIIDAPDVVKDKK